MTNEALSDLVKKKKRKKEYVKTCHSTRQLLRKAFGLKSRPGETAANVLSCFSTIPSSLKL